MRPFLINVITWLLALELYTCIKCSEFRCTVIGLMPQRNIDETCGVPVLEVHYLVTNMIHFFAIWNHGCHIRSYGIVCNITVLCVCQ